MGLWQRIKNFFTRQKRIRKYEETPISIDREERPVIIDKGKDSKEYESILKEEVEKVEDLGKQYDFSKTRPIKVFEDKIRSNELNSYMNIINKDSVPLNDNSTELMSKYGILLKDKVSDKKLFDDLVKHRDILLKKRITMKLQLNGEFEGEYAICEVYGCLPEYESEIMSFFIGSVIESGGFNQLLSEFKDEMSRFGKDVLEVRNIMPPKKRMEVKNINIYTTFK